MVLVIFYQSSLLVSISFPIKSHTLDYASDLLEHRDEWTWGYEPTPRGTGYEFFKNNSLPIVQEINKYLEVLLFLFQKYLKYIYRFNARF